MQRRNQKGFTLMELMVVIVIVAILAAVAVPLYINYVKDAARTEAKGAIGAVITAEQVYFQQKGTYIVDDLTKPTLLNVDLSDVNPRWTMTITNATNDALSINATQTGPGAQTPPLQVNYTYTRSTGVSEWTTETP